MDFKIAVILSHIFPTVDVLHDVIMCYMFRILNICLNMFNFHSTMQVKHILFCVNLFACHVTDRLLIPVYVLVENLFQRNILSKIDMF